MQRRGFLSCFAAVAVAAILYAADAVTAVRAFEPVAPEGKIYDKLGRYQGRVTGAGRRYDWRGRYEGRTTENGRREDHLGGYAGRVAEDGRY